MSAYWRIGSGRRMQPECFLSGMLQASGDERILRILRLSGFDLTDIPLYGGSELVRFFVDKKLSKVYNIPERSF